MATTIYANSTTAAINAGTDATTIIFQAGAGADTVTNADYNDILQFNNIPFSIS